MSSPLSRSLFFAFILVFGCKKSNPEPDVEKTARDDLAFDEAVEGPVDAPDPPVVGSSRCRVPKESRPFLVRGERKSKSDDGEEPDWQDVSVGAGVTLPSAYAVGLVRGGAETRVEVLVLEGDTGRTVEIARVHGDVNPPRLVAVPGALVGVFENHDAQGRTYRLFRVHDPTGAARVSLGDEVLDGRDESSVAALATTSSGRGLLVWDRENRALATSELVRMSFDEATLATRGSPLALTARRRDEEAPSLVATPRGFFLVAQSFARKAAPADGQRGLGAGEADERGVTFEPPAALFALELDEEGKPQSSLLELAPPGEVTAFDVALDREGALLVAVTKKAEAALAVVRVRPDGSTDERRFEFVEGAPAAPASSVSVGSATPLWLEAPTPAGPRLFARDRAGQFWMNVPFASEEKLEREIELARREPLARRVVSADVDELLVVEARASDLEFRRVQCGVPRNASPPNAPAAAPAPAAPRP